MRLTISNLPVARDNHLELEMERLLLKALEARKEKGLFLSPIVLQPENGRGYLGFSAIGSPPCALWYSLKGYEPMEEDPGSRLGFDTGHILEAYVLDLLGATCRQKEVRLEWPGAPGGQILGHLDGMVDLPELPGPLVIECKATGGYSFSKKEEEGPDPAHVAQAFCYCVLSKARGLALIYMNREAKKASALFKVFAYELKANDPKRALAALVRERFTPVLEGLGSNKPPAFPSEPSGEFGPRGWRCRPDKEFIARGKVKRQVGYCAWRHICPEALRYASQNN